MTVSPNAGKLNSSLVGATLSDSFGARYLVLLSGSFWAEAEPSVMTQTGPDRFVVDSVLMFSSFSVISVSDKTISCVFSSLSDQSSPKLSALATEAIYTLVWDEGEYSMA